MPVPLGRKACRALQAAVRNQRPALGTQVDRPEKEVLRKLVGFLCVVSCRCGLCPGAELSGLLRMLR